MKFELEQILLFFRLKLFFCSTILAIPCSKCTCTSAGVERQQKCSVKQHKLPWEPRYEYISSLSVLYRPCVCSICALVCLLVSSWSFMYDIIIPFRFSFPESWQLSFLYFTLLWESCSACIASPKPCSCSSLLSSFRFPCKFVVCLLTSYDPYLFHVFSRKKSLYLDATLALDFDSFMKIISYKVE